MSRPPKHPSTRGSGVGYGNPPLHTRFKKGVSGNPGGRPRGISSGRAIRLALKEIFRPMKIREGDRVSELSGFQVLIRQLMAQAAKGSGPSARMLIQQTLKLEESLEAKDTVEAGSTPTEVHPLTTADRARALAAFIKRCEVTKT